MNILVVSGESGGHVMPAFRLYQKLENCYYLGSKTKLELSLFKDDKNARVLKPRSHNFLENVWLLIYYNIQNLLYYHKLKIDKIIIFGSFSSLYIYLFAKLSRADIYVHEQNSILGDVSRIYLRFAKCLFSEFPALKNVTKAYQHKIIYAGSPSFYKRKSPKGKKILLLSGSKGSESLNTIYNELVSLNKYDALIINGTGEKSIPLTTNMEKYLNEAFLIVSRSGATILHEAASMQIPLILIPSPNVKNNHQYENAISYLKKERGYLILEQDLSVNKLVSVIDSLINNPFKMQTFALNAYSFANLNSIEIIKKEMGI